MCDVGLSLFSLGPNCICHVAPRSGAISNHVLEFSTAEKATPHITTLAEPLCLQSAFYKGTDVRVGKSIELQAKSSLSRMAEVTYKSWIKAFGMPGQGLLGVATTDLVRDTVSHILFHRCILPLALDAQKGGESRKMGVG